MCECSLRNCQGHQGHLYQNCHNNQPSSCHHQPPSHQPTCNCHQPSCNCHQPPTCRCQEQTVETVVPIKVEITPDISFCVEQADVKTEYPRHKSPRHKSPRHKSPRHKSSRHKSKCDCYDCYRKYKRR